MTYKDLYHFKYQAEETGEGNTSASSPPALDEAKMQELIKNNVSASMREVLEQQAEATRQASTQVTKEEEKDFWDDIIDPKLDKKVNTRISNAELRAEAAEDKVEFYSSDKWLEDVDDFLTGETEAERKAEKAELRKEIEKTFGDLLKAGRGTYRAEVADYVLGKKLTKDKAKFIESISKKQKRNTDEALEKARRGVDISSTISNFVPADIHAMPVEKMLEQYGNVSF